MYFCHVANQSLGRFKYYNSFSVRISCHLCTFSQNTLNLSFVCISSPQIGCQSPARSNKKLCLLKYHYRVVVLSTPSPNVQWGR